MDPVEKLTTIFREALEDESIVLTSELNARDIDNWDSFNHMNLMILIEEGFGITIDAAEVDKMRDVGDMVAILNEKCCQIELLG